MIDIKLKIENIEHELDIRVESLISEIRNYHDEYKLQLEKYKKVFENFIYSKSKYIQIIFELLFLA